MNTKDDNYLRLINGLKAMNISSNAPSLNVYSNQIELNLSNLKRGKTGSILDTSMGKAMDILEKSSNLDPIERINAYIEFGETYKSMLDDLMLNGNDYDTMKKIVLRYLDIADKIADERVINLATSMAENLSKYKPNDK